MNDMKQKDDTMRATPETDASTFYMNDDNFSPVVNQAFARRLESERDETREELAKLHVENDHNWQAVAELEKMTELARELRDALTGMEEYYRQHLIQGSLFLQVRAALTKAKEVLG